MTDTAYIIFQSCIIAVEFLFAGAVCHTLRAVINPFPDKISDNVAVNVLVSSGYGLDDHIFGTEYDDVTGYYKLDSFRNLKISMITFFVLGIISIVITPEIGSLLIQMNEWLYAAAVNNLLEAF